METPVALPKLFRARDKRKGRSLGAGSANPNLPLPELFQDSAPSGGGLQLPRFSASAVDQPSQRDDRFAGVRMKLRRAYTPSQPVVDPRMFAGRMGVLKAAIRAIEDQRLHLVIYGERGIGKTSLLQMLASAAREARYIVIYLSCGAASNFDETFRSVATEIPLLFHGDYSPTNAATETGDSIASLLGDKTLLPRQFGDICNKLTGTRVLVILDEFDRSESVAFRRDIAELIKVLSDRSARVQLVIAGVAADLAELVEHIPSVRRNILAAPVPLMSSEEIEQLVSNGERTSDVTFAPQTRDYVVAISAGSPYIASLICHHAALNAVDDQRLNVLPEDVNSALEQAIGEFGTRISKSTLDQLNRLLDANGTEILGALARASLAGAGEFDIGMIETSAGSASMAGKCKSFVTELAARSLLLTERDDGVLKRFAFIEDAVPSYIWFLTTHQRLRGEKPKAEAEVAPPAGARQ
jgi:Cdc6-like AAA superfamily ATPase